MPQRGSYSQFGDEDIVNKMQTKFDTPYADEMRYRSPEKADAYTTSTYTAPLMDENLAQARTATRSGNLTVDQIVPDAESARRGVNAQTGKTLGETQDIADQMREKELMGASQRGMELAQTESVLGQEQRTQDVHDLDVAYREQVDPVILEGVKQDLAEKKISVAEAQRILDENRIYSPQERQQELNAGDVAIRGQEAELSRYEQQTPAAVRSPELDVQLQERMIAPTVSGAELENEQQAIQNEIQQVQGDIAEKQALLDLVVQKKRDAMSLVEQKDAIETERQLQADIQTDMQRSRQLEDTLNAQQEASFRQRYGSQGVSDRLEQEAAQIGNVNLRNAPAMEAGMAGYPDIANQLSRGQAPQFSGESPQALERNLAVTAGVMQNAGLDIYVNPDESMMNRMESALSDIGTPESETVAFLNALATKINSVPPEYKEAVMTQMSHIIEPLKEKYKNKGGKSALAWQSLWAIGRPWDYKQGIERSNRAEDTVQGF